MSTRLDKTVDLHSHKLQTTNIPARIPRDKWQASQFSCNTWAHLPADRSNSSIGSSSLFHSMHKCYHRRLAPCNLSQLVFHHFDYAFHQNLPTMQHPRDRVTDIPWTMLADLWWWEDAEVYDWFLWSHWTRIWEWRQIWSGHLLLMIVSSTPSAAETCRGMSATAELQVKFTGWPQVNLWGVSWHAGKFKSNSLLAFTKCLKVADAKLDTERQLNGLLHWLLEHMTQSML